MIHINEHYTKLQASYLFTDIARRVEAYQKANPDAKIIKLGIGDVTQPLTDSVVSAFHQAVDEMAVDSTFRGYGPEQGYEFLRSAIAQGDYHSREIAIEPDEVFVSDGAKCDSGNFQELFGADTVIAVPDPVYPVYVDTNVMAGRTGAWEEGRYQGLVYLDGTPSNGFVPSPPDHPVDLIYLCFPNNPTGAVANREQLQNWVDYARRNRALILFDAAYVEFIRDPAIPHSIFEIPGANEVAVEFRSFSKTAGFTGTRCAYTVVPKACTAYRADGSPHSVRDLWSRRQTTKFNGVSYPVQRAAAAIYTPEGRQEIRALSDYYLENAHIIRSGMEAIGYSCTGGSDAPYIWVDAKGAGSWELFEKLLHTAGVVTTPGSGFGKRGEGFIRISAFNHRERVEEAMERIQAALR